MSLIPTIEQRLDAIEKKIGIAPAPTHDIIMLPPMSREAADKVLMVLNRYCGSAFAGATSNIAINYAWDNIQPYSTTHIYLELTMKKGA